MNRPQRVAHVVALAVMALCVLPLPVLAADCPELVHHWPGSFEAVAVEGDYAYLGGTSDLFITDVSDPSVPRVVGEVALAPGLTAVAVSGGYAYVAATDGLRVIDVTAPSAPVVVASLDTESPAAEVAVSGDYAYVVEVRSSSSPSSWIRVIDISTPSTPVEVTNMFAPGQVSGLAVSVGYAHAVGRVRDEDTGGWVHYLRVIDVSTPSAPVLVGFIDWPVDTALPAPHVTAEGAYAYVAGGSLRVIDVSTPSMPVAVGFLDKPGEVSDVAVSGNYTYVVWNRFYPDEDGLYVTDVSTPSAPKEVGYVHLPVASDLALSGGDAYLTWRNPYAGKGALRVIDVGTPVAPVEVGSLDALGSATNVAVSDSYAYVTGALWSVGGEPGGPSGIFRVIDVASPSAPVEAGSLYMESFPPTGVVASGDHAYLVGNGVFGEGALRVIDISAPSAPVEVGFIDAPGSVWGVAIAGGYAYVTWGDRFSGEGGLRVIDISAPSAPVEAGFIDAPGFAWGVAVADGYAYATWGDSSSGEGGLQVIDVSTPSVPVEVGSLDIPGGFAWGIAVAGGYAYAVVSDVDTGEGGLLVIDVRTPSAPVEVGVVETPEFASEIAVSGEYAYLAYGDHTWGVRRAQGLRVIGVSSPSAPAVIGFYETPSNPESLGGLGIAVSDGSVYYVAGDAGMYTFAECTGPTSSFIPAAALAAGAEGAFFQTDLELNNNGPEEAQVSLQWLPRGEDNSEPINSQTFTLAPGASLRFDNVLTELFELSPDSFGALKLDSSESVIGMSRTYNIPGGGGEGTFGQGLPVIRATDMIIGTDPQRIIFLSEDFSSRANVGCVNGSSRRTVIHIEIFDDEGTWLETATMDLGPWSNDQINRVFQGHAPVNGYVDVWAGSLNARYYCYGSMLDNLTSDPTTILPQAPSAAMSFIPAAALSAGLAGSFFRTDVDLNNVGSSYHFYKLRWLPRGADNSDPDHSSTFSLAPGAGVRYTNVLGSIFGLEPDQVGALAVDSYGYGRGLLAMSRTYNLPTAKLAGSFGQGLPGIPADKMIQTGVRKRILFMSENEDVRANVGCVNGVGTEVVVTIELYDSEGVKLETTYMMLPPYSNRQINGIFQDYAPINGYVDVRTSTPDALIYCYGSVLDNVTSDPTTVLPQ